MQTYNPNTIYIIGDKVVYNGLAYQMLTAPGIAGIPPPNPMYWTSIPMPVHMELDFSGAWSWSLPLWGLALLIANLGVIFLETPIYEVYTGAFPVKTGGALTKSRSR